MLQHPCLSAPHPVCTSHVDTWSCTAQLTHYSRQKVVMSLNAALTARSLIQISIMLTCMLPAGSFSSFLFQLLPQVAVHTASGVNQNFQYCGHNFASLPNGIGFGGQVCTPSPMACILNMLCQTRWQAYNRSLCMTLTLGSSTSASIAWASHLHR